MDFAFSPEQEGFRREIDTFVRQELPDDWMGEETAELTRWWLRKLGARGWLCGGWPPEHGGLGWDIMRQVIFKEVTAYHRTPAYAYNAGAELVGPILLLYGTEEQKRELLGPIIRGEHIWGQWFTEPDAGSDLANIRMTAVRDGDDYVLNGEKLWCVYDLDWGVLMARTDPEAPKHKGISYFVVKADTPGLERRPMPVMSGETHTFSRTIFHDVRVPVANLVGEENRGWYVAMATMDIERSSIAGAASARRTLDDLVRFCKEGSRDGSHLTRRPQVRNMLANMAVEVAVGTTLSYLVASKQLKGEMSDVEASIIKLYSTELTQRLARAGTEILGLFGQLAPGSRYAKVRGLLAHNYLSATSSTVSIGTSEIMRNVIAVRGLGLPRD